MTFDHVCERCQAQFVGRSYARFCSERCRKRASRARKSADAIADSPDIEVSGLRPVAAATLRELEAAGQEQTAAGLATITLARRLDSGRDVGSSVAALVRQHRESLARALERPAGRDVVDALRDELAERRSVRP